jgi:hypothetical protein
MEAQREALRRPGKHLFALVAAFFSILMVLRPASAQSAQPPTLDEILQRLEGNLQHYNATVPSFFCDEHVLSKVAPDAVDESKTTNSAFRLMRTLNPDKTVALTESREIKTVNDLPVSGAVLSGPAIVSGAFSGGLSVVSLGQKACMRYTLHRIDPSRPRDSYVVDFVSVFNRQHPPNCLLREDGKGRVFIDPATMEVTRVEVTAPHHTIIPGVMFRGLVLFPSVVGKWVFSVDYAPIALDGRTFWMPKAIDSTAWSKSFVPSRMIWTFKAQYSNYHKLEVTSHIVPDSIAPVP